MFWGNILIKKSKFYRGPSFPRDVITSPLKEIGVWQQKMSTFVCTFKLYCGLASFISIYRYFVFALYECYFWLLNKRSFQWWWMFYYTFNFVFVNSTSTNAKYHFYEINIDATLKSVNKNVNMLYSFSVLSSVWLLTENVT